MPMLVQPPPSDVKAQPPKRRVPTQSFRYVDRGIEKSAEFPIHSRDDVAGIVASASSGPLKDYQDKLKAIQLRERGTAKGEIAEKLGRSEHWVKRWWREHPAAIERPAGTNDVVLQKASLHSFRDLDIRRSFADDKSIFETLTTQVQWRQAKVVARDHNTGELGLRYDERGRSINAGRQVADYSGGLDVLDRLLQKVFTEMNIRDPQARIFMNYYVDGKDRTGVHRHDFWTCLLSFGISRILTVDGRPFLLRNGDLIIFGTQNHGVPVMPDAAGGRISLVIFFYPDADNLERQWQTITDEDQDNDDAKLQTTSLISIQTGVDHGFNAAMLWGDDVRTSMKNCCVKDPQGDSKHHLHTEPAALVNALDPASAKCSLMRSPNSTLCFEGQSSAGIGQHVHTTYSVVCNHSGGDSGKEERDFFAQLAQHEVKALWDFRARQVHGSWCEPEVLRRICAKRLVKYRHYPLGKREAGGVDAHLKTEEGRDVIKRFISNAEAEVAAFAVAEKDWKCMGCLREAISSILVMGELAPQMRVLHLSSGKLEEHTIPQTRYGEQRTDDQGIQPEQEHLQTSAGPERASGLPFAGNAAMQKTSVANDATPLDTSTKCGAEAKSDTSLTALGSMAATSRNNLGSATDSAVAAASNVRSNRWGRRLNKE